ncbi:MAG: hypothetical protein NZ990_08115 [Myxococcota bacterium]|nr:hypothetical protein [Myxococcota bacterium]
MISRIPIFSRKHWMPALSVCVLLVLWVEPALACTVCTGIEEEATRKAFVGTTALLTFLPMLVVGVMVWLFVRRTLARERMEEARQLEELEAEGQGAA